MSYRLPPLNGLRAFEAAARHLSFTRAADELGVTPGAVSQQVKALEMALGVGLFRRLPRGIVLTPLADGYLPQVSTAFRLIAEATEAIAPALRGRKLRLGIAPQIRVNGVRAVRLVREQIKDRAAIRATDDVAELLAGKLDALLRTASGSHPGLHADRIRLPGDDAFAVLLTLPGLAGCREHRGLVKLLRGLA